MAVVVVGHRSVRGIEASANLCLECLLIRQSVQVYPWHDIFELSSNDCDAGHSAKIFLSAQGRLSHKDEIAGKSLRVTY